MTAALSLAEGLALLGGGGALGAGALKVVEAWLAKRRTPEQQKSDAAASARELMTAAAAIADGLMKGMRDDIHALRGEIARLNDSHDECERQNQALEKLVEELTQSRRADRQQLDSLMRNLASPQAAAPGGPLDGAVIEMAGGRVNVTQPARRARKST